MFRSFTGNKYGADIEFCSVTTTRRCKIINWCHFQWLVSPTSGNTINNWVISLLAPIDLGNGVSRITDISRSSINLINYSHVLQTIHSSIIASWYPKRFRCRAPMQLFDASSHVDATFQFQFIFQPIPLSFLLSAQVQNEIEKINKSFTGRRTVRQSMGLTFQYS